MSDVFRGTIFSIPSSFPFDSEKELRKKAMREERDQLSKRFEGEGFYKRDHTTVVPYVNPRDPVYRAIEKALGK